MKMKEVLNQTGLTDRAVRLYIDSGLVAPNIEESYSGRKNIEFSEEDVNRLKNIALLRKVGFSIPDIKEISQGGENTKPIIEAFIQRKQESVENDTLVLEKLKNISFEAQITMDSLCSQLSCAADNKQVPQEDLQLSKAEKRRREDYVVLGASGIVAPLVLIGLFALWQSVHLKYPVLHSDTIGLLFWCLSGWGIILVVSIIMLVINLPKHLPHTKQNKRKIASRILMFVNYFVAIFALGGTFLAFLFGTGGYSYTDNPDDYMVLDFDIGLEKENLEFFPVQIPECAIEIKGINKNVYKPTTKYYYRYEPSIDSRFDIVAQWQLPKKEFNIEVELRKKQAATIIQKGDWVMCYNLGDDQEEKDKSYYFIIAFAYNKKTYTVRYMTSYGIGGAALGPYYLSLDW